MKRSFYLFLLIMVSVVLPMSCIYYSENFQQAAGNNPEENNGGGNSGNNNGNNGGQTTPSNPTALGNKITSLQILLNSDDVKDGDTIDLSKYNEITDYTANINKAVTIQSTKKIDFDGASLNVMTDGVALNGIKSANVTTQSSMKISGSSLSSLSIASVPLPSASMIAGRGGSSMLTEHAVSRSQSDGNTSVQPPVVEVEDTVVAEDVSVGIANAYLTVENFTAKKNVSLDAANVQLTINDKATNIKEIKTDKVCQVILEDGTSDTIPTPNVSGEGELKQIDVKAAGQMKLLALTPMSGLTTVIKQGEAIDFRSAAVLGTYKADDGVTVFKAGGLSYTLTETFSKLEKDFKITVDGTEVYKNGKNVSSFWADLEAKKYTAVLDIDYQHKETKYEPYQFDIVIIGVAENQTEIVIPTFSLTEIKVDLGSAKNEYSEGEPLNLAGLLVMGTYQSSDENIPSYQSIVRDYTLEPPNGTPLTTTGMQNVTVKAESFEKTVSIKVKPIWSATFVIDASDDAHGTIVLKVVQEEKVRKPNDPVKSGFTFGGWYADEGGEPFDFDGTIVSDNITLTAKWTANTYEIKYFDRGGVSFSGNMSNEPKTHTYGTPTKLAVPTKLGYDFGGWFIKSDCSDVSIDTIGASDFINTIMLYADYIKHGSHIITYHTAVGNNSLNPSSFEETDTIVLKDLTADGYTFAGWYDSSSDFSPAHHITSWEKGTRTKAFELWAKWNPALVDYTVKRYFQNVSGNGYVQDLENYNNLTKQGYTDSMTDVTAEDVAGFDLQTIVQQTIAVNGSTVVDVKYNRKNIDYTFKANGGEWSDGTMADKTVNGRFGASVSSPAAPTKTGYTFNGWTPSVYATFGSENVTFTAQWTANQYDIIYKDGNSDGFTGIHGNDHPTKHTYGQNTTLVSPTKEHYQFDGWHIKSDCTDNSIDHIGAADVTAGITLYAKWTENPNYTVIFIANGGTGTMENQKIYLGEETSLTENSFVKGDDYSFYRWYDKRLGGGNSYYNQASVTDLTGDGGTVTLYAIWRYNAKNSYIDESGDIVIGSTKYSFTSFVQVMDVPVIIVGSNDNWSSYLASSAVPQFKGAFISGRTVTLSPYSMAQYLMTQELYREVMRQNIDCTINSSDVGKHPAYNVSWYDAIAFCNKLSLLMGKEPCYTVSGITDWANLPYSSIPTSDDSTWNEAACDITKNGYRLPTEAEWEFAARGGDQSKPDWKYAFSGIDVATGNRIYDGTYSLSEDDNLATVGWYNNNSLSKVHPVGCLTANRLGLYDMSGNLFEWCWDWYNSTVTSNDTAWTVNSVVTNPRGAVPGSTRCLRGGQKGTAAYSCSVSSRHSISNPFNRSNANGFRLVCSGK